MNLQIILKMNKIASLFRIINILMNNHLLVLIVPGVQILKKNVVVVKTLAA